MTAGETTKGGRGGAPVRDSEERRLEDADTDALVARIQAGADEAFADLYERYFDRVYAYLRVLLRDSHEAEDATQLVFTKVFEALPRYEKREQPFRAWLFTIARNHGLKRLKQQRRQEPVEEEELARYSARDQAAEGEVDLRVLGWISDGDLMLFVERLPLAQRQVLIMRFMLDLTTAEIAEILDRSPEAVRMQQSRALAFLRTRLSAIGRGPARRAAPALVRIRQARVLRLRRFSLSSPGPTG